MTTIILVLALILTIAFIGAVVTCPAVFGLLLLAALITFGLCVGKG